MGEASDYQDEMITFQQVITFAQARNLRLYPPQGIGAMLVIGTVSGWLAFSASYWYLLFLLLIPPVVVGVIAWIVGVGSE